MTCGVYEEIEEFIHNPPPPPPKCTAAHSNRLSLFYRGGWVGGWVGGTYRGKSFRSFMRSFSSISNNSLFSLYIKGWSQKEPT